MFDRPWSKRDPVHREGSGVPRNRVNGPPTVETGVLLIGRGVACHKTDETDLCCSATSKRGEGCGVPQNGTPRDTVHLHRRPPLASTGYCSSTVDLLQPPPATVHSWAHVHPASTVRYSIGYCSTGPLHGLLFNHPSTGYYSSCPPPSTVHPTLHGVVLFIQPSTGSCSSSPNWLDRSGSCSSRGNTTGSCSSTPTGNCSSTPPRPQHSLFIQRQHRSASVSSSSEGIARSGSVNSHRSIARVQ